MFAGCSVFGFLILLLLGRLYQQLFLMLPVYFCIPMCQKGSVRQGVLSWLNVSMIALSLLKGLFRKIPEISEYPKDVMWVKRIQGIKPY